jgi:aldehyde:ferredoxin oxidoreductase
MAEEGNLRYPDVPLEFGNPDSVLGLIHKIGRREGIGDLLAQGPKRAALELGKDSLSSAMQVKNSGFAAWMPRRMKGTGLAFATSNRGACHKRAPIGAEITGAVDMDSYDGKAAMVIEIQNTVNAIFTLITCRFHEFVTDHRVYPEYLHGATGMKMDWESMSRIGEKIWNLEKLFNLGAGFTKDDDMLPKKCYEPIVGDSSEGAVIDEGSFEKMLEEYYSLRGWDAEGVPSGEKLRELGIEQYGNG